MSETQIPLELRQKVFGHWFDSLMDEHILTCDAIYGCCCLITSFSLHQFIHCHPLFLFEWLYPLRCLRKKVAAEQDTCARKLEAI